MNAALILLIVLYSVGGFACGYSLASLHNRMDMQEMLKTQIQGDSR